MKNETNAPRTRGKSAANPHEKMLTVPLFNKFRAQVRREFAEDSAASWIPVECSLLIRYEFAACSLPTRYIFVAILLLCGLRGSDKVPANTRYLSNALAADERSIKKALAELIRANLLSEREQIERIDIKDTQTQTDETLLLSVNQFNPFKTENQNQNRDEKGNSTNGHSSKFSIDECLQYVEQCRRNGDNITNAQGLARSLFQSGTSDSFILAALYPERLAEQQAQQTREIYGEPVPFSDELCAVCFGAKMEIVKDKGARICEHCKDERGKPTGFEPKKNDEK